jgi:hypothetical protein
MVYLYVKVKVKVKFGLEEATKAHRGSRGTVLLFFLTSALDRGGWLTPRPGRFIPEKEIRCPLYRRLGEPQGRSGRLRKISPPPVFDPRTVLPKLVTIPTELSRSTVCL